MRNNYSKSSTIKFAYIYKVIEDFKEKNPEWKDRVLYLEKNEFDNWINLLKDPLFKDFDFSNTKEILVLGEKVTYYEVC